jgi:transcriptional regulator with XRE-family HTH domain
MDRTSFGVELRRSRIAAGLSLSEFARMVSYSKGYLSKIETGAMPPNADLARRCDAKLGAGGTLSALHKEIPRRGEAPNGETEVWVMALRPDGASTFVPMRRRDVLRGGAVAVAGLASGRARTPTGPGGAELVAAYRDMFDQTRRLGQAMSPSLMLPQVIAQAQTLRALARDRHGAERDQLVLLAARFAEYAGWMSQECGDNRAALWWTNTAVRMAGEAGDRQMSTYALVRRALIALYRRDARTTIALASRAQSAGRVPARIRGLAAQREAQGHALAGDHAGCLRALDRAEELHRSARGELGATPVLGSSFVTNQATFARAWSLYDLGRPAEAAALLDEAMPTLPPEALRSTVRFGVRRVLAHAATGEVDHACALACDLLPKVAMIDSATVLTDLRLVAATLRRWPRHPAVAELTPELTATLRPARIA